MTRHQLIILGLTTFHVLLSLLVVPQWIAFQGPDHCLLWLQLLVLVLAPVQGCLLAVWTTFSDGDMSRRALVSVLGVTGYAWVLPYFLLQLARGLMGIWLANALLQVLLLLSAMVVLRFMGLRLVDSRIGYQACAIQCLQYTLLQFLLWTTTIAVLFAFPYQLPWRIVIAHGWVLVREQFVIGGISISLVWLVLGPGRLMPRFVLCMTTLALLVLWSQFPVDFLSLQGTLLTGSLIVVRLAGNRLHWHASRLRGIGWN